MSVSYDAGLAAHNNIRPDTTLLFRGMIPYRSQVHSKSTRLAKYSPFCFVSLEPRGREIRIPAKPFED